MKNKTLYIVLIISLLILFVFVLIDKPKEIDWKDSFTRFDKIPFGSWVLRHSIDELFKQNEILESDSTIYQYLKYRDVSGNYIFINDFIYFADGLETNSIMDWVYDGNTAFISGELFNDKLLDTLGLSIYSNYGAVFNFLDSTDEKFNDLKFVNPLISGHKYRIHNGIDIHYIDNFDTLSTTILGYAGIKINFVSISFGKGKFLIHTTPHAFSNYFMLQNDNYKYAESALSYLNQGTVIWDEYYKTGKRESSNPLKYIQNHRSFSWAYYITISGVLIFFIFKSKRLQRAIPVIEPLRNSTVDFVSTLTNLFYQKSDNRNIALKKIAHFNGFIRNNLHIDPNMDRIELITALSNKTGLTVQHVKKTLLNIDNIDNSIQITSEQLTDLNFNIDKFYKKDNYGYF